jgi:hypothetical protein
MAAAERLATPASSRPQGNNFLRWLDFMLTIFGWFMEMRRNNWSLIFSKPPPVVLSAQLSTQIVTIRRADYDV